MTKLALISSFFPPAGTVQRPLKLAAGLATRGIETHVVAPDDAKWIHVDDSIEIPRVVAVHRVRYIGPKARRVADDVYGRQGIRLGLAHLRHVFPRILVPDEMILWAAPAAATAIRLIRRHGIDVVMTSSSPSSVHVAGAAVKLATGAGWIADVRDSLEANPQRREDGPLRRAKLQSHHAIARVVAEHADAIVAATEEIAEEFRARRPAAPVALIPNGCDFDDFAGLEYARADQFRLTHTGSFCGARDPRPVLEALAHSERDVVARFVGDFRPRDLAYAAQLRLGERLEIHAHVAHRRALEFQRDTEALLLLIPDAGGRGRGVVPAKLFEYLAAGRPILAVVPAGGEAAAIVRETDSGVIVEPRDVRGIGAALTEMVDRFEGRCLEPIRLSPAMEHRLSRDARLAELQGVVERVALRSTRLGARRQPAATTRIRNA